ncbi:MAG: hypothetical protein SOV77_09030 [Lachnospiraceae bacterium]|nr:hypothetical protein [Lachnospiraceae bacterium]MDY2614143.1 hypothetical protein [Lachnospiraceae bacterium]MDY4206515.1 hypothetical protein [Lachnospiraceae bacterium]
MTREEKETIMNDIDGVTIQPGEAMNLTEIKAYVKGYEDSRNAFMDSLDKCYRSMKTD